MSKLRELKNKNSELWAPFTQREIVEAYQSYTKYIDMEWVKGTQTFTGGWTFIKKVPEAKIFNEEHCDKLYLEPWLEADMRKKFKTMFM